MSLVNESTDEYALLEKTCRICLDNEKQNEMISPCLCSGHSKYVHRYCLDEWRSCDIHGDNFKKCKECLYEYRTENINVYNPTCRKLVEILSTNTILLLTIIVSILWLLYIFFEEMKFFDNKKIYFSDGFDDNYLFLSVLTFLSITMFFLLIHDIYVCFTYKSPKKYYENYANCGLASFIAFFIFSIFIFSFNPIFGTIAITFVLKNIIKHILKTRYQYSVVEESPVIDLDYQNVSEENEISIL